MIPISFNLTHQGDAMILRGSRFKSQTIAPSLGHDVYKYGIFFTPQYQCDDYNER